MPYSMPWGHDRTWEREVVRRIKEGGHAPQINFDYDPAPQSWGKESRSVTPEQLERRNAAIRKAWDDPLLRARHSVIMSKPGSRRSSREATNAYFREYRIRKLEEAFLAYIGRPDP